MPMYRNYQNLKEVSSIPTCSSDYEQAPIIKSIFACSEVTGWPVGSIAQYKNDASPEVRDFIERSLLQPNPSVSHPAPDADTALEAMRQAGESDEDYFDRLKKMARNEKDNDN